MHRSEPTATIDQRQHWAGWLEKDSAQDGEFCLWCGYPFDTGDEIFVDEYQHVYCSVYCAQHNRAGDERGV